MNLLDQYGNPVVIQKRDKYQGLESKTIKNNYDPNGYDFNESFQAYNPQDPRTVHTTAEMLDCLRENPNIELDARILGVKNNEWMVKPFARQGFLESFKANHWDKLKFKEQDFFASGNNLSFTVGNDFIPLLGGPFFKNLYFYQDYIRMHQEAFFAYNNDPIARAITQITRDFVLGGGYEVQCDQTTREGQLAMSAWRAFEEANSLPEQIDQCSVEQSVYGENLWWWLPNQQTKIVFNLKPGDTIPIGLIPRVRLTDPSTCVEIVTYPEDITRVLFYVFLFPTQYQIYTSGIGAGAPQGPTQPTLKFIYQTVPADQIMHFKINSVSNEKRGRSDYFPVFSYLKRLRDSVNFSLIGLQKASAWAIDTEVDGDQTDIDNYSRSQAALGTIPNAGSEFVHSTKIKRTILASQGGGSVSTSAFEWSLSMICAGVGIPVSYLGTHLSGGTTKASALVATEPVAKKMQKRQDVLRRMLKGMWQRLMKESGLPPVDVDIIFPEIIPHDKSQKLKDLLLMQQSRWISPKRAADMAAKEQSIQNFVYDEELTSMEQELPEIPMPLLNPGKVSPTGQPQPLASDATSSPVSKGGALTPDEPDVQGVTSQDRKDASDETL